MANTSKGKVTVTNIAFLSAAALATCVSMAVPVAYVGLVVTSLEALPSEQELQKRADAVKAEWTAASLDERIDKWYLKSSAFLHCKRPDPEFTDVVSGLRDRAQILSLIKDGRCTLHQGYAPPPACGYGACYAIAALIMSAFLASVT